MGLLEEVKAAQYRQRCRVAEIAGDLGEEGAELLALASDETITLRSLVTVLRRRGVQVSDKTISRHRRGECEC